MSDAPRSARNIRFSWHIIALSALGAFLLAVIGSITAGFLINKKFSDLVIDQGRQITSTLAHQSILPLLSDVGANAREEVDATLGYSSVRGIAIFDKEGHLLVSDGENKIAAMSDFPADARPFEPLLTGEREDVWEFTATVYDVDLNNVTADDSFGGLYVKTPELLGYVSVTIDRTSLYKIQAELLRDMLLVFVGLALLLTLVAIMISRQMTRPLDRLAGLMKRAEDGQDGIRAALDGPLEIHNMARAFNTMMDALEQRQAYAEEQHRSLVHEIAERQLIEQQLRESEHRLISIFNNVVDGILILDDEGFIESANPVAAAMLESAGDLAGRRFGEVINALLLNEWGAIPTELDEMRTHCFSGCHFSIQRGGNPLEIDAKFSAMEIKGSRKYIAIIRDITETERQKGRIESLLAQHETIVSSVPGIMMELNTKGVVLWCNKHTEQVVGYSAAELQQSNISQLVAECDRQKLEESMAASFAEGRSELHAELLTTHGTTSYQLNMAHMSSISGNEGRLLLIGLDDSQSVTAQRALQKARDAALESARIKSEFLANMSHEIRTPMNGMFGMLQLLSGSHLNDEQKSYAEIALRSADQLLHIINDILDFSKIEAGKLELDRVEMSPRTLIEDAVELFSQRAHAKGVRIYSKVAVNVPEIIQGDPTRLNQIISNLIGNAIKFTDRGHILVHCAIEPVGSGLFNDGRLVITVEDTGIGIDISAQERIFESFIQADGSSTRRYSGTGLGLAIVKQLVELMGGRVALRSAPGQGSEFSVTLPLHLPENATAPITTPMIPDYHLARYVGEDPIAAAILQDYLRSMGYRLEMVAPDQPRWNDLLAEKCELYLVDYERYGSDALVAQLSGHASRVVVMLDQAEKSHLFTPAPDLQLCTLVRPIRYHALRSCLEQGMAASAVLEPATTEKVLEREGSVVSKELRILVVEDNETNLRVIDSMLGRLGYSATNAENGRVAVELVKQQRFDIVFMDCQMPVMDGYQATAEIRQAEPAGEHAIIIAMTGNAMEGDRERCLMAGMDDYIPKPVRLTILAEALSKWVGKLNKA